MESPMEPVQLLSPDGVYTPSDDFPLDLTPELCTRLLRHLTLARRFDQEALALQRQGELALWLQSWGQEAAQVGSIAALRDTDWVFPSYREHASALYRGIPPGELLSLYRGSSAGGWNPARYRFHVVTVVLAAQLLHATGFAMGAALDGSDEIVLTYFGDGASSEGDASESLNWAATFQTPILFFCQNNQWAISTPSSEQAHSPLHLRARGFGLSSHLVDGNDVLGVLAVTRKAASDIRDGGGPAFIEARTYRMGGHSTSDNPKAYRLDSEVDAWAALDPLERLRRLMTTRGWADEASLAELAAEADELAAETRRACHALTPSPFESVFDHVLAGEHAGLAREREAYLAYAASFTDSGADSSDGSKGEVAR